MTYEDFENAMQSIEIDLLSIEITIQECEADSFDDPSDHLLEQYDRNSAGFRNLNRRFDALHADKAEALIDRWLRLVTMRAARTAAVAASNTEGE